MTTENTLSPVLYILMRTDLASMNPGKAVAQGSHAANKMVHDIYDSDNEKLKELLGVWEDSANGFGTCIVLSVDGRKLDAICGAIASFIDGVIANVIVDPTYPLKDGAVTHLIPLATCGYVFGDVNKIRPFLSGLDLMQ